MKQFLCGVGFLLLAGCGPAAKVEEKAKIEPPKAVATPQPEAVAAPEPEPVALVIPAGTRVVVRTTNEISTKTAVSGEAFTASLEQPLRVDGKVIAPKGALVDGVIAESDEGGRVKGVASMSLRLTRIQMGGKRVAVRTGVHTVAAPATKKKDAIKVGIGAGIGAAIGAIAGGGKGAAVGAASGGAAGTGVVLATRGDPAVVPAESVITFRLTSNATAPVR